MALDEHQVITSQVPETVQQTLFFIQRWLWFVDHHCFSIVLRLPSYVRKGFIIGLEVAFYLASYQFLALITVLSSEWEFSLFFSVITTNIYEGVKLLSVVLTTWLGDTYLDNRRILLYSTSSYCFGLGLWCYIFPTYQTMFVVPGLLLILVGQCGYESYLNCRDKRVYVLQLEENNNGNEEQRDSASLNQNNGQDQGVELEEFNNNQERGIDEKNCYQARVIALFISQESIIFIVGFIIAQVFPDGDEGYVLLIVIFLVIFLIFFLKEMLSKDRSTKKLQGSPLSIIFKVYILAFTKRNDDIHGSIIYTGDFNVVNPLFDGNIRFLNRAALYNPLKVDPSVEFDQGRLCTLQQVEDTKRFINAMLLSLSFLMYGVMTAVADTFILERVNNIDYYISDFDVPIQWFVMTSDLVRKLVSYICKKLIAKKIQESSRRRFYGALRVGIGMLLSVPYFVIASFIEKKILKVIKADDEISGLWFTPQIILVGLMDGLAVDGMECFFDQETPPSIGVTYSRVLSDAIVGLGKLLGVGWFCFWYFITKRGDKSGWFGDDIDNSRLDNYYLVMAVFGLLSTLVYTGVVTMHSYSQKSLHN